MTLLACLCYVMLSVRGFICDISHISVVVSLSGVTIQCTYIFEDVPGSQYHLCSQNIFIFGLRCQNSLQAAKQRRNVCLKTLNPVCHFFCHLFIRVSTVEFLRLFLQPIVQCYCPTVQCYSLIVLCHSPIEQCYCPTVSKVSK